MKFKPLLDAWTIADARRNVVQFTEEGRRAFLAYRTQRAIAQASEAKLRQLERLFETHRHDRMLVFTSDNDTVYKISRRFLIAAITHQTKVKERHETLQRFNAG